MAVQAINTTAGTLTYSGEGLVISAFATVTVPLDVLLDFYLDPLVVSDIKAGNLNISDTITMYTGDAALQFLNTTVTLNFSIGSSLLNQSVTALSQTVSISTVAMGSLIVQVEGTFSATLVFEATVDGSNWFNWFGISNTTTAVIQSVNSPDQVFFNGGGIQQFRVRCSAYTSGTATVSVVANQVFGGQVSYSNNLSGDVPVIVNNSSPFTVTANQGTANSLPNAWPVYQTDGGSNPISTTTFNNGSSGLNVAGVRAISQIGVIDTHNSSTTNLGAGSSFTGSALVVTAHGAAEITIFADQPLTVQAEQSSDGTHWDIIDSYTIAASTGDSRIIQLQAQEFRLMVTNNGASSTTVCRIQTLFKPIANALPRSLTQLGNLKIGIQEGSVGQGSPNTLANKWPVQVTDGTNTMSTMDVAARAGFQKITDGTNTAAVKPASVGALTTDPAAVVALSPNTPLPAGTNALGTVSQGAKNTLANAWTVQVTDGTNTMPSMDVAARSGYQKITDGANVAAVKAASTAAVATDPSAVVAISPNTPLPSGTNAIGTVQPGNTPNTTPWLVKPHDGTNPLYTAAAALADAVANPTEGRNATDNHLFNGSTWDRQRNNTSSGAAIDTESLSGAGTTNGATQTNYNARGAIFTFVTSALSGTSPSVTISIQYSYDGGTTFVTVPGATTAAIAAAATTVLQVYPGIATTANANVSSILPRVYRLQYVFTGSSTPKMTVNSYVSYVL